MADISDVSEQLVSLIGQAIYPNGTGQASSTGGAVKVFAGWPLPQQLDADLKAVPPLAQISVWPRDEEKNTSRYDWDWKQPDGPLAATVTAAVAVQTVTIGGAAAAGQNVAVLANGQSFVYAVQASDTPASIATALATLMVSTIPGTASSGAVLTLPGTARLAAVRIGVLGTVLRELRRQERRWQLSIWAPDAATRDLIASTLDAALAPVTFLTLPDGSAARIKYWGSHQIDAQQREGIYRRDLFYTVEYATTQSATATQVITEQVNVTVQNSNQAQIGAATVNL